MTFLLLILAVQSVKKQSVYEKENQKMTVCTVMTDSEKIGAGNKITDNNSLFQKSESVELYSFTLTNAVITVKI